MGYSGVLIKLFLCILFFRNINNANKIWCDVYLFFCYIVIIESNLPHLLIAPNFNLFDRNLRTFKSTIIGFWETKLTCSWLVWQKIISFHNIWAGSPSLSCSIVGQSYILTPISKRCISWHTSKVFYLAEKILRNFFLLCGLDKSK